MSLPNQKLILSKETLCRLNSELLSTVQGAQPPDGFTTACHTAACTDACNVQTQDVRCHQPRTIPCITTMTTGLG